ncbi:MAG: carbohydrate kinase family protein [Gemmatimonadota bacterium]|nr:carbohydrate kinase family protein [Gemmatimonadota bacterium]
MKIAIIGIINHDTITMANGQELQDLGGILYNTAVLANLVEDTASILPISKIGADCRDMMRRIIDPYDNVDSNGIVTAAEGTSRNTIRYDENMEKVEQLTNHIAPIPFAQIEPYLDSDAFLINFITGDDISQEVLREIRSRSLGLVYLDVHNLCLGIDDEGYRFHRPPEQWEEWMRLVDVVQMNEVEARLLAGKDMETDDAFVEIGNDILGMGPSIFIATRGRLGSVTVYNVSGTRRSLVCPPDPVDQVIDTTGCGDAFAAGFLTDYLVTRDPISATRLASWTAGVNCTLAGLSEVDRFRERRG